MIQHRSFFCAALIAVLQLLSPGFVSAQTKTADVVAGTTYTFPSQFLKTDVPVNIHLPAGYENGAERFPVLYMLDFGNDFRFAGPVADFLQVANRIPGLIVCAIAVDNLSGPPQAMIGFVEEELFPWIEKTWRTRPCRLLYGHSGRSFATLFILLNRPDLFYAYICPGLGLADPPMPGAVNFPALAASRLSEMASLPKSLFFSIGDEKPFEAGIAKFTEVLKTKAPADFAWKFVHMADDDHFSTKLKTLYQGLEFAFEGLNLPTEVAERGVEAVKDHYERLGRRFGFALDVAAPPLAQMIDDAIVRLAAYQHHLRQALALLAGMKEKMGFPGISEGSYGLIGSFVMNEKRFEDTVMLYEAMTQAYPQSASAWDGFGRAHEKVGRADLALADYEKACEFGERSDSPKLAEFRENLERLRKALGR